MTESGRLGLRQINVESVAMKCPLHTDSLHVWGCVFVIGLYLCFSNFVRPRPGKFLFFLIKRGPGPNKFTRNYLSIFLSSQIKLTKVLIINCGIIIKSINTLTYTVWHADKYKITFELVINLGHWHLLHRCYLAVLGLSFSTHSRILFSSEYFHYKIFIHEEHLEN
jgi:hypothetical protein